MARKKQLIIEVSGYITRIVCGKFPIAGKKALVEYLLKKRDDSAIPAWIIRRNPNYLSSEEIKSIWYLDNPAMKRIMKGAGLNWENNWAINEFCDMKGFGSGKEGIGLFEICVHIDNKPVIQLFPFEPAFESNKKMGRIEDIRVCWHKPEPSPLGQSGYVAVSAGTWAKGTALFGAEISGPFLFEELELVLADLTNMGTGEDSFVAGFRYAGESLPIEITRETDMELLPVSWFSTSKNRWLEIGDPD
jgi:hypothetical protein